MRVRTDVISRCVESVRLPTGWRTLKAGGSLIVALSAAIVSGMVASVMLGPAGDQVLARDGYSSRDIYNSNPVAAIVGAVFRPAAGRRSERRSYAAWTGDHRWSRRSVSWNRVARASPRRNDAAPVVRTAWSQPSSFSTHTVCVRLCDGYHFPVGDAHGTGDIETQVAVCASACPGAPTRLYTVPSQESDIGDAIAVTGGQSYTALPVAYAHTTEVGPTCACHRDGEAQAALASPLNDITMREGDSVMTPVGWRIFRGTSHWPYRRTDFSDVSSAPNLPKKTRSALIAIENASVSGSPSARVRGADLKIRVGSTARAKGAPVRPAPANEPARLPVQASADPTGRLVSPGSRI